MRQRRENELNVVKGCVVGRDVLELLGAQTQDGAPLFVRRSERQREPRMLRDDAAELLPSVPACAEYPNTDSIHA